MKNKAFPIILLSLLIIQLSVYSQSKSDTAEFKIGNKFSDRKMAWSVNTLGLIMNTGREDFYAVGVGTTLEKKLWDTHSLSSSLNLLYVMNDNRYAWESSSQFRLNLDLSYRYYYNLNHRMRNGLTGNNFNANYFILTPNLLFLYQPYMTWYEWDFQRGEWKITSKRKLEVQPYLRLGYGIQRNVWKNFNVDVNAGFQINQLPDFRDPLSLFYLQLNLKYIIK